LFRIETWKTNSGHCEARVRRGNLFDNQWLTFSARMTFRNVKNNIFKSKKNDLFFK